MIEFTTSDYFKKAITIKLLQDDKFSSRCELRKLEGSFYVAKFIGKQFGGLSIIDAKQLDSKCQIYYQTLKSLGLSVPKFFKNYYLKNKNGKEAVLVNLNNYCGQPLSSVVKKCNLSRYLVLIHQVLDSIMLLIQKNTKFFVSLDPNLDNFVVDNKCEVTYVDFCPPLINENKSGLKIWEIRRIDEHDQDDRIKNQRYFTIQGLFLLFVIRAWSKNLEYGKYLISAFINFSEKLSKIQQELIFQSTFYQILIKYSKNKVSKEFLKQIIREAKPADRDLLRLIFLVKISQKKNLIKRHLPEQVFQKYKSPSKFTEFQHFLLAQLI